MSAILPGMCPSSLLLTFHYNFQPFLCDLHWCHFYWPTHMSVSDYIFPHDSAHPPASTDLDHTLVVCDYFFIFGHYLATGHSVSKNNIRVLCREQQWHRRKVKEAIYIKPQGLTMNRDHGYQLPPIYTQILPPVSGWSQSKFKITIIFILEAMNNKFSIWWWLCYRGLQ